MAAAQTHLCVCTCPHRDNTQHRRSEADREHLTDRLCVWVCVCVCVCVCVDTLALALLAASASEAMQRRRLTGSVRSFNSTRSTRTPHSLDAV